MVNYQDYPQIPNFIWQNCKCTPFWGFWRACWASGLRSIKNLNYLLIILFCLIKKLHKTKSNQRLILRGSLLWKMLKFQKFCCYPANPAFQTRFLRLWAKNQNDKCLMVFFKKCMFRGCIQFLFYGKKTNFQILFSKSWKRPLFCPVSSV